MRCSKRDKALRAKIAASQAKHRPAKDGTGTGEGLKVVSGTGCWCGKPWPHDWPGKETGARHPRKEDT